MERLTSSVIQIGALEAVAGLAALLACALVAWLSLKGQLGQVQDRNAELGRKLDEANGRLRDLQDGR